jgi:DNA-binding XRE family transcriptional regulator
LSIIISSSVNWLKSIKLTSTDSARQGTAAAQNAKTPHNKTIDHFFIPQTTFLYIPHTGILLRPPGHLVAYSTREKNKPSYEEKEGCLMPYNRMIVGHVIGMLREQKGFTQEVLSGLAGISRSHLTLIENGRKTLRLSTLWQIADALQIAPSAIIAMAESKQY